ncbi:hypothetical protein [Nocardia sp. NPDC051750]|uniref:hypothetical protein n=1 Tax=Nocardia sp. NPDC051750 TaxID=3364325 RepID=UPI003795D782
MAQPPVFFQDRRGTGRTLSRLPAHCRGDPDVRVLGSARGGLPVAWEVAAAPSAPMTLVVRELLPS